MSSVEPTAPLSAGLVPELEVSDFARSLDFYVRILGFTVLFSRPERPFAYLEMGSAQMMIEQGGGWITGPLEKPFGRGINFLIRIDNLEALQQRLRDAASPVFSGPEDAWYRRDAKYIGSRELLVQDPDGYLLRFSQGLGVRHEHPQGGDVSLV